MSLTTIMDYTSKEYKGFRSFLSESFPKPKFEKSSRLLSLPISSNPSLIGTAFDYLLRFHLEKKFKPKVYATRWVSENAIDGYFKKSGLSYQSIGYPEDLSSESIKQLYAIKENAPRQFELCKSIHAKFLQSRRNDSGELLKACLFLARLDNIYRRTLPTIEELRTLYDVSKNDMEELKSLINCCTIDQFKPNFHIILNPRFNTNIISADADLVVDETLIDVKVTKHLELPRGLFNQLIGYYLLYLIGGISENSKLKISKLGIYFARHNFLWTVDVEQVGSDPLFRKATDKLRQVLRKHPFK
jgi:hypothetical protein